MSAIRIHTHLDSDTPHLPELRELVGHDVVITVAKEQRELTDEAGREFWGHRTLDELAAAQGYVPRTVGELRGPFTAEEFEGFDEFLEASRNHGSSAEDK